MRIRTSLVALLLAGACAQPRLLQPVGPLDLVVAATTDVHGHIRGWNYATAAPDTLYGLARAATIIDSLRRVSMLQPVVLDAGDLLEGSPLTDVAARDTTMAHPVIAAMNAIQYDAAVIGNHDFNYGLGFLERARREADFPLLAANLYTATGTPFGRNWVLATRRGIRVAIIGATTPGSMVWDRDNLTGRATVRDIVPAVRQAVQDARDAGVSAVIVVLHSGLDEPSSYDTVSTGLPSENVAARVAHEVPGIDLIVYGHSHKQMADTVIGTTLLMQPQNWAGSVAVAHLRLSNHRGQWYVSGKRSQLVPVAGHREDPRIVAVSEEAHRAAIAYSAQAIGSTPDSWRADSARVVDSPITDFVLEAERRAAGAQLASTAIFSTTASLAPGPITVAEIAALYPYDNTLRAVRITGAQLRAYLERSAAYFVRRPDGSYGVDPAIPGFNYDVVAGVDYTIDLTQPVGARITKLEYDGHPVAATDAFTLALNNYRQTGGGGYSMLRDAPVVYDRQQDIRTLLIDEVRRAGTLHPSDYFHPNWRIVPPDAVTDLMHHSP